MSAPEELPPGLSFVHIPKNGGTSVIAAINEHQLPFPYSGHRYPRQLTQEEFVVLRDPVQRFVSALYYGQKYWTNPINLAFATANELAEAAADPAHPKHETAWVEMGNAPDDFFKRDGREVSPHTVGGRPLKLNWVYAPQNSWLTGNPVYLLRHTHLNEDFAKLLEARGHAPVSLSTLNQSAAPREELSPSAMNLLRELYAEDFAFLHARGLEP